MSLFFVVVDWRLAAGNDEAICQVREDFFFLETKLYTAESS